MQRSILFLALALTLVWPRLLQANAEDGDDTPPISITSPDTATTFAYGTVKDHTLIWYKKDKMLVARITFTDAEQTYNQPEDDTHEFRLPGVILDPTRGIFYATSAKGEAIPVARYKKALFFTVIETTANAAVRVLHPRGNVTIILEAISPNDPAMQPSGSDPDGTHKVDIQKVLN